MRPVSRAVPFAVVFLLVLGAASQALAASVHVDPAYGYRIGDSIVASGRLVIDDAAQLDSESLPRVGRVNGWLALLEVRVVAEPGARRVVRTFQVTASAVEPRLLFLPKADLRFKLGAREITERLEAVPISVSALSGAEPFLRTGFGALRPDRDVPAPRPGEPLQRAQWLAAALAGLGLLWLAVRGYAMRRRGYAPFGKAAKALRRLARRRRHSPDALATAFRFLHEAFNETAGRAVFASQRDRFLVEHVRFKPEAADIRRFFERSNEVFFAGSSVNADHVPRPAVAGASDSLPELPALAALAQRLSRLERPGT